MNWHELPYDPSWGRPQVTAEQDLRVVRSLWYGRNVTEVVSAGNQTIADVVYTIVAVTLAEPLRGAFDDHAVRHACDTSKCEEAQRLWLLMPEGDTTAVA